MEEEEADSRHLDRMAETKQQGFDVLRDRQRALKVQVEQPGA